MPISVGYEPVYEQGQAAFTAGGAPVQEQLLQDRLRQQEEQRQFQNNWYTQEHQNHLQMNLAGQRQQGQGFLQGARFQEQNQLQNNRFQQQDVLQQHNQAFARDKLQAQLNGAKQQTVLKMTDGQRKAEQMNQAQNDRNGFEYDAASNTARQGIQAAMTQLEGKMNQLAGKEDPASQQQFNEAHDAWLQKQDDLLQIHPHPKQAPPLKDPTVESQNVGFFNIRTGRIFPGEGLDHHRGEQGYMMKAVPKGHGQWEWVEMAAPGKGQEWDLGKHPQWQADEKQYELQTKQWEARQKLSQDATNKWNAEVADRAKDIVRSEEKKQEFVGADKQKSSQQLWAEAYKSAREIVEEHHGPKPQFNEPQPVYPDISKYLIQPSSLPADQAQAPPAGQGPPPGLSPQNTPPPGPAATTPVAPQPVSPAPVAQTPPVGTLVHPSPMPNTPENAREGEWYDTPRGKLKRWRGRWFNEDEVKRDIAGSGEK